MVLFRPERLRELNQKAIIQKPKKRTTEEREISERNLGRMLAFFRNYHYIDSFLPQPMAKIPSEYELIRALPENLRSSLLSIEELEAELGGAR